MTGTGNPSEPERYAWDEISPILLTLWGRDHFSTLAYLETVCVDHGGKIANDRMRVCPRRHRGLIGPNQLSFGTMLQSNGYPTVLRDGRTIARHDDWDCLNDMVAAGLAEITREEDTQPYNPFGGIKVEVRLTPAGLALAAELRAHKAGGGTFSTFTPEIKP